MKICSVCTFQCGEEMKFCPNCGSNSFVAKSAVAPSPPQDDGNRKICVLCRTSCKTSSVQCPLCGEGVFETEDGSPFVGGGNSLPRSSSSPPSVAAQPPPIIEEPPVSLQKPVKTPSQGDMYKSPQYPDFTYYPDYQQLSSEGFDDDKGIPLWKKIAIVAGIVFGSAAIIAVAVILFFLLRPEREPEYTAEGQSINGTVYENSTPAARERETPVTETRPATPRPTLNPPAPFVIEDVVPPTFATPESPQQEDDYPAPTRAPAQTARQPATPRSIMVNGGSADVGTASPNQTVTITANFPPTGQLFMGWTSEQNIRFANPNSETTTFNMPTTDVIVTANFGSTFIRATSITMYWNGVRPPEPFTVPIGWTIPISGTVVPYNATNQHILWSIPAASNNTNSTIGVPIGDGGWSFNAGGSPGTFVLRATITGGSELADFRQDFTITVD